MNSNGNGAGTPQAVRLQMDKPGLLRNLRFAQVERRLPGPDEIEIEVRAVGLNYREVLKALGVYPGHEVAAGVVTFDGDCSGRIANVGSNVTDFSVGDDVVALGADVFGTYTIQPAAHASLKPESLTHNQAATLPVVFATAYYALNSLAHLRKGESVLIHSAAGGVGLAAVQWAQLVGATIFATAGNEKKRDYLRSIGVSHVMDSRSFDFVEQTREATSGRGVDVVLNSLAGEFVPKSLSLLAPFGRFLEIGKMDIYSDRPLGLYPFRNNLAFFGIDLLQMSPAQLGALIREILGYIERKQLQPLEHAVFPLADVARAFRLMRQSRHVGKVVVSIGEGFTI